MRIKVFLVLGLLCFSVTIFGQEIGSVVNGEHSVTLLKSNDRYACVYSDSNCIDNTQKSFNFPVKETVYNIIIDGFSTYSNHQVFVKIDENTIVKFQYKIIDDQLKLRINHNDLYKGSIGESTYLSKDQVQQLFGVQTNFG